MKPIGSRIQLKNLNRMSKRFLLLVLIAVVPWGIMSFSTPFRDAELQRANGNYHAALLQYEKALAKKPNKADKAYILFQMAECQRNLMEWNDALKYYDKAVKAGYPDDVIYLRRADAKRYKGDYAGALEDYKEYQKRVPSDPAGKIGEQSCELATQWEQESLSCENPWVVKNVADLNTKDHDFSPAWSDKKHKGLLISSKRPGQTGTKLDPISGNLYCDVFTASPSKTGKWSTPTGITGINTSDANEGSPIISKNGNKMFFTRCGQAKKEIITCKIYSADKSGNGWNNIQLVDFGLDAATLDSFNFRHPALSANGEVMVFSSDLPGSRHADLWLSVYDSKTRKWGKPVQLGPEINTDAREGFPYIHEDGTLYFASDGHPGMGGLDIFSATKSASEWKWSGTTNMKYPLNSSADDLGLIMSADKRSGYLTSSRQGTKGGDDIWSFGIIDSLCPMMINGQVNCEKYGVPVEDALVHIVGNDGSSFDIITDATGAFSFKAKKGTQYVITAEGKDAHSAKADHYFNLPEDQKLKVAAPDECPCVAAIGCKLKPVDPIEIKFPAVLYEYNSDLLTEASKDSLDFLFKLLTDNPTMVIELGSHTDCRGSADYNRDLAQRRAQSCVNYLIEKGIPRERIVAKGYGEDQPFRLDENTPLSEAWIKKQPHDKQEYYHSLNRRTVFRVLNYNYVPKGSQGNLDKPKPIVRKGFFDASDSTWTGGELIEEEVPEKDE